MKIKGLLIILLIFIVSIITLACGEDKKDKGTDEGFKLSVWSEFDSAPEVISYFPFLKEHKLGLYLAIHYDKIGDTELKELFFQAKDMGIEVRAWILLDYPQGYWPNEDNVELFFSQTVDFMDWCEAEELPIEWLVVDMELGWQEMGEVEEAFQSGDIGMIISLLTGNINEQDFLSATGRYQDLVSLAHQRGFKVMVVTFPMVLDDFGDGDTTLQDALDIPIEGIDWDEVSFMAYRTTFSELWGEEFGPYLIYSYSRDALESYGDKAGIDVGLVRDQEPTDILADIGASRAAGINKVHIYSLDGIMDNPPPDDWVNLDDANTTVPEDDQATGEIRSLILSIDEAINY
ncbi:MAG: hypothetical protein JSU92_02735 [Deltaproteobacteria bacterium]|nr:MAG: hypothetical protein JSU92_02735 [Deltaproteobacteria bacterium]